MRIESVRALKEEFRASILAEQLDQGRSSQDHAGRALGVRTQRTTRQMRHHHIALGVNKAGNDPDHFQLAVRVQHPLLMQSPLLESIRNKTRGEADIQFVGPIHARQAPWYQQSCRPLLIGASVGHYRVTAGSLGAFVRDRNTGNTLILSNNHVLADENRGTPGDDILQPGSHDGGQDPADTVAGLAQFTTIEFEQADPQQPGPQPFNIVDCAAAAVTAGIAFDINTLTGFGPLTGLRAAPLIGNETTHKIGRSTGNTTGSISAVELDSVSVDYEQGSAVFHAQIEIQGTPTIPFSDDGDSGSLIFDDQFAAFGLLFAGSATGGPGNLGYTYVNPLGEVLNQLNVDLLS